MKINRYDKHGSLTPIKRVIAKIAALVVSLCAIGCSEINWLNGTGEYGGYVMRMRGPRQVTDWTLRQVDDERVYNGICGLGTYLRGSAAEREAALAGIEKVYIRLSTGWPETPPKERVFKESSAEYLIRIVYSKLLEANSPETSRLFFVLQPAPDEFPQRYSNWWEIGRLYNVAGLEAFPAPHSFPKSLP